MIEKLTAREHQVLLLLAQGSSNRGIAGALAVSEDTVKYHLKNIYAKLGARRRTQAVAYARNLGVLPAAEAAAEAWPRHGQAPRADLSGPWRRLAEISP